MTVHELMDGDRVCGYAIIKYFATECNVFTSKVDMFGYLDKKGCFNFDRAVYDTYCRTLEDDALQANAISAIKFDELLKTVDDRYHIDYIRIPKEDLIHEINSTEW